MGPFEQSSLKGLACLLVLIHARPVVPREVANVLGNIVSQ